jgi:hypothetical protein
MYIKNYAGVKKHLLLFIKPTSMREGTAIKWEAICDCGNTTYVIPSKKIRSCGCLSSKASSNNIKRHLLSKKKDHSGQKYNHLTFIKQTDKKQGSSILWEVQCDCGKTCYHRAVSITSGHTKSCGCKKIDYVLAKNARQRKFHPCISTARAVWQSRYKEEGGCDFDTFYILSQQACFYCGREPYTIYNVGTNRPIQQRNSFQMEEGNFTYNGLDRIDNSKGHTPDNVRPCCVRCNRARNDMTVKEFLDLVKLIYHRNCNEP